MTIDPLSIVTNGFQSTLNLDKAFTIALFGYGFLLPSASKQSGGTTPYTGKHPLVNPMGDLVGKKIKINLYINDSKISQSITKTIKKISIDNIKVVEMAKKVVIKL
jgi:hypothetical protein